MSHDWTNPFYLATREVFRLMLDLDIQHQAEQLSQDELLNKEAQVSIGVVGDLEGTIYYSFPQDMTLEMVKIMCGMEMDSVDDFVASALSEIVNIISGNAMTNLNENNYSCDILTPSIKLVDKGAQTPASKLLSLPLQTSIGPLRVELDLQKKGA